MSDFDIDEAERVLKHILAPLGEHAYKSLPPDMQLSREYAVAYYLRSAIAHIRKLEAELKKASTDVETLRRLEAAGVDNWDGYGAAFDEEE